VVFGTVLLLAIFRDLLVRVRLRNLSQRTVAARIGDIDGVAANYREEGERHNGGQRGSHIPSVAWDMRKTNRPMRTMFTHTTTRVRAA
jgi:hypothetical protein